MQIGYPMKQLNDLLTSIHPGQISDSTELEHFLAECWDEFDGSDANKMAGYKLHGRMENIEWNPPVLSFIIERHGGTVQGSTRAMLYEWNININVNDKKAICGIVKYRQVNPMQPKLDVHPMAEEVVQIIIDHQEDERLIWKEDASVHIQIGKILPEGSAAKQTIAGRRKRFRKIVDELLANAGWQKVGPNAFTPPTI